MMKKKPVERFQSPDELEAALQKLNSIPVNTRLLSESNFFTRLLHSSPDLRKLGLAMCALLAISFVAGRRMERPITIPKSDKSSEETVPTESSAIRQYAVAMLQPHRSAAWEAVIANFPDTPEADLAELRLGLTLMSGLVPDNEAALKVFTEVRDKSSLIPEKQYLVLLGMLGRAYALKELERSEDYAAAVTEIRDTLPRNQQTFELDESKLELDLDRAPEELRRFCHRILDE
jgi:hypothetical protein